MCSLVAYNSSTSGEEDGEGAEDESSHAHEEVFCCEESKSCSPTNEGGSSTEGDKVINQDEQLDNAVESKQIVEGSDSSMNKHLVDQEQLSECSAVEEESLDIVRKTSLTRLELLKASSEVGRESSDECMEGPSSMFGVISADQKVGVALEADEVVEAANLTSEESLAECAEGQLTSEVDAKVEFDNANENVQALTQSSKEEGEHAADLMSGDAMDSAMISPCAVQDVLDQGISEHDSGVLNAGDKNGDDHIDDRDELTEEKFGVEENESKVERVVLFEEANMEQDRNENKEEYGLQVVTDEEDPDNIEDGKEMEITGTEEVNEAVCSKDSMEEKGNEMMVEEVPQSKTEGSGHVLSVHSPPSNVNTAVPLVTDPPHVTLQPNVYARRHQKKEKIYNLSAASDVRDPDADREQKQQQQQKPKSDDKVREQDSKEKLVQKKGKEKQKVLNVDREKLVKVLQKMLEEKEKEEKLKEQQQSSKTMQEEGEELKKQQSGEEEEYYQGNEYYGEQYYGEPVFDYESGQYYYPGQEYYLGEDGQYHVWSQEQGYSDQSGELGQDQGSNQQYVEEGGSQDPSVDYPGQNQRDSGQEEKGVESRESAGQQYVDPNQQYQASDQEYFDPNQQYVDVGQQNQGQEYVNSNDPSQAYSDQYSDPNQYCADPNDPNQQYVDPTGSSQQYTDPNDPNQYIDPNDPNQQYVYGDPNQQYGSWEQGQYYSEEQDYQQQEGYEEYSRQQPQYSETEEEKYYHSYDPKYPPTETSIPSEQTNLKVSSQEAVASPQQAVPMMSPQHPVSVPTVSPQQAVPMASPSRPVAAAHSTLPRMPLETSQPSSRSTVPASSASFAPHSQSQPMPPTSLMPLATEAARNPMSEPPHPQSPLAAVGTAGSPPGRSVDSSPPAFMQQNLYPPVHQAPPSSHQVPPSSHLAPPTHQTPPAGYQAPPPGHQAPPPGHQAPLPGHQAPPPGHQAPPSGHQAPPSSYQAPPPGHQAPPPGHQAPLPGHPAPRSSHQVPPNPQAPPPGFQGPPPSHHGRPQPPSHHGPSFGEQSSSVQQQADILPPPYHHQAPSSGRHMPPPEPFIPPTSHQLEFRSGAPASGAQERPLFHSPLAEDTVRSLPPPKPLFPEDHRIPPDRRQAVQLPGHRPSPPAISPVLTQPDPSLQQMGPRDHQQLGPPVPPYHPPPQSNPSASRPSLQDFPLAQPQSHLLGKHHHTPSPTSQAPPFLPTSAPPPTSLAHSHHPSPPPSGGDSHDYGSRSESNRTGKLPKSEGASDRRWGSPGRESFQDNSSKTSKDDKFHSRFQSRDGSRWFGDRKRDSTRRYRYSWRSGDNGERGDNFYLPVNDYPGRREKYSSYSGHSSKLSSDLPKDPRSRKAEYKSERSKSPQHYSKSAKYAAALNYVEKRSSMLRVSSKSKQSEKDKGPPFVKPHSEEPLPASNKKKSLDSSHSSKSSDRNEDSSSGHGSKKSRFKIPKHTGPAEPEPASSLTKSGTKIPALDLPKEKSGDSKRDISKKKKERDSKQLGEPAEKRETTKESSSGKSSKPLAEDKGSEETKKKSGDSPEISTDKQQGVQDLGLVPEPPSLEGSTENKPSKQPVMSEEAKAGEAIVSVPLSKGLVASSILKSDAAALVVSNAAASGADKIDSVKLTTASSSTVSVVPTVTSSIDSGTKATPALEVASSLTVCTNTSSSTSTSMSSSTRSSVTSSQSSGKPASSSKTKKKGSEGSKGKGKRRKPACVADTLVTATATLTTAAEHTASSTTSSTTITASSVVPSNSTAIKSETTTSTGKPIGGSEATKVTEAKKKVAIAGKGPAPDWSSLLQRLDPAIVQALAATVQQTLKQTSTASKFPSKIGPSITTTSDSTTTPSSTITTATPTPTVSLSTTPATVAGPNATPTSTLPDDGSPTVSATPSTSLPGTSVTPTTAVAAPTSSVSSGVSASYNSANTASLSSSEMNDVFNEKVVRRIATLRSSTIALRYSSPASTSPSPAPSSRSGTPHASVEKTGKVASSVSPSSKGASRSTSPAVLLPVDSTVDTKISASLLATSSSYDPSPTMMVTSPSGQGLGVVTATILTSSNASKLATLGDKSSPNIVSSSLSADERLGQERELEGDGKVDNVQVPGTAKEDRKSSTPASELGIVDDSSGLSVFVDSNYHVMYKEYNLRHSRSQTGSPKPAGKNKSSTVLPGKRDRSDTDQSSEEKAAKKIKIEETEKPGKAEEDNTVVVEKQVKVERDVTGNKLQKDVDEAVDEPLKEHGSPAKVSPLKRKASVSLGARSRKRQKVGAIKKSDSIERASIMCALCLRKESEHNLGFLYGPYRSQANENEDPDKAEAEKKGSNIGVEEKRSAMLWIHEDCAVWAPGVCQVGGKLLGLHDAVTDGKKLMCRSCKRAGATLCCHSRACKAVYHYPCAKDAGCSFKEDQFLISCPKHKLPS